MAESRRDFLANTDSNRYYSVGRLLTRQLVNSLQKRLCKENSSMNYLLSAPPSTPSNSDNIAARHWTDSQTGGLSS